jgi:hypothetical protein
MGVVILPAVSVWTGTELVSSIVQYIKHSHLLHAKILNEKILNFPICSASALKHADV